MIEHYIAVGFGLSMIIYFFGQMLRLFTDVVDDIIAGR